MSPARGRLSVAIVTAISTQRLAQNAPPRPRTPPHLSILVAEDTQRAIATTTVSSLLSIATSSCCVCMLQRLCFSCARFRTPVAYVLVVPSSFASDFSSSCQSTSFVYPRIYACLISSIFLSCTRITFSVCASRFGSLVAILFPSQMHERIHICIHVSTHIHAHVFYIHPAAWCFSSLLSAPCVVFSIPSTNFTTSISATSARGNSIASV